MRSIDEVRDRFLTELNGALRHPGMYGGELMIRQYMATLSFIDGRDKIWEEERRRLHPPRGPFGSTGVEGFFKTQLAGIKDREAYVNALAGYQAASVYACIAHGLGYLRLDGSLDAQQLASAMRETSDLQGLEDTSCEDVIARFGQPSLTPGSNAIWPASLLYVTDGSTALALDFGTRVFPRAVIMWRSIPTGS